MMMMLYHEKLRNVFLITVNIHSNHMYCGWSNGWVHDMDNVLLNTIIKDHLMFHILHHS